MIIFYIILGSISASLWFLDIVIAFVLLVISIPLRIFGKKFTKDLRKYARNIALSGDQDLATKGFGQDPDVSISEMLGRAKLAHNSGKKVPKFWLQFGDFVDKLFYNKIWRIERDHIVQSTKKKDTLKYRIFNTHKE